MQAFFSTINSLLANRALLKGLGVGDASSSATFALLLTICKDATSRIAVIVFAHRFGLAIEPDAKRYRFLADLCNDSAFFFELASPYLGPWAKMCALGVGEALRATCGVAAGASKAALSAHFARLDNLAELNAKEASQETAVGLMGLLCGTLVVNYIQGPRAVLGSMIAFVLAHLWMNYLAVRSVVLNTFNRQRATIVYQEFLRSGTVLTPEEVGQREQILLWSPVIKRDGVTLATISMASSYRDAMGSSRVSNYEKLSFENTLVCLWGRPLIVKIMLLDTATPCDAITAWFTALEFALGYNTSRDPERLQWKQLGLCDALKAQGWNLDAQCLETEAPIRVQMMDSKMT